MFLFGLIVGGGRAITDALEQYELKERFDSLSTLPDFTSGHDNKMKPRRVSRMVREQSSVVFSTR